MKDIQLAWRSIRNQPGFSALVIVTLALTIGAATTVFSLFDAILLRPFPFPGSNQLVRIRTEESGVAGSLRDVSLFDLEDLQRGSKSFTAMAAHVSFSNNLAGRGPAQPVFMTFATPDFLNVLGIQPHIGRFFTQAENQLGGDLRKVVLSYSLWQDLFGGTPQALNQTIQLRGETYTVIGVMPRGFNYPGTKTAQVWVPIMARYAAYKGDDYWKRRDTRIHETIARLRPEATLQQAQAELASIAQGLSAQFPDTNRNIVTRAVSFRDAEAGEFKPYVNLVAGAVLVLLLIGCVNVANLFLARASARQRELAIRIALGSPRWRLLRQLLVEALLYATLGGVLGGLLANAGIGALRRVIPVDLPTWMHFELDLRVMLFLLACCILTTLLFGLTPSLQQLRPDVNEVMKQGAKGSVGTSFLRLGLVVSEVGLSCVLLICAGLMLRSFAKLMDVNTGIKTDHLVVATVSRFVPNLTKEQLVQPYSGEFKRIRDRLAELPGVVAAAAGNDIPYLNQPEQRAAYEIYTKSRPTKETAYKGPAQGADVMPGFFDALGIPLLEGRDFTEADQVGSLPVVIVSQRAAQVLWPGQSAVGQQVRWGSNQDYDPWMTVIGVVGNTRWQPAETKDGFEVYWSYRQYPSPSTHLLLRTGGDPKALLETVRQTIRQHAPESAIERVATMQLISENAVWQRRLWGFMLTAFGALALTLAAVGLYGVMSYLVASRTREIGIRLAIGAMPSRVLGMILQQGLGLAAIGTAVGVGASFAASGLLANLLFGVDTVDAVTLLSIPLLLLLVAVAASIVPAWRAARVDPLLALRAE